MFGKKLTDLAKDTAGKVADTATDAVGKAADTASDIAGKAAGAVTNINVVDTLTNNIPTETISSFATSCKNMLPDVPNTQDVLNTLPEMYKKLRKFQDETPLVGPAISAAAMLLRARLDADPLRGGLLKFAEQHGSQVFGDFLNDLQDDDFIMLVVMLALLVFIPNPFADILDGIGLLSEFGGLLSFLQ